MKERRMVVAALISGLVLGWFAHVVLEFRYFVVSAADSPTIRIDRRTGQAWRLRASGTGESYQSYWDPIQGP